VLLTNGSGPDPDPYLNSAIFVITFKMPTKNNFLLFTFEGTFISLKKIIKKSQNIRNEVFLTILAL
jgi:hypothetical protein